MHSPGDYILLSADKYEIKVMFLISTIPDFKCMQKSIFKILVYFTFAKFGWLVKILFCED